MSREERGLPTSDSEGMALQPGLGSSYIKNWGWTRRKGGNLYAKGGDYGLRDLLTLFLKPGARSSLKDFWGLR